MNLYKYPKTLHLPWSPGLQNDDRLMPFSDVLENFHQRKIVIVVRNEDAFHYNDFQKNVAKYVRKGHVQTDEHWMSKPVVKNLLCNQ